MSSTNKTATLELNQWVGTDPVLMADFNADNSKLDTAIAALQSGGAKLASGTYTGNGGGVNTLTFPFPPKLLVVTRNTLWYDQARIAAIRGQRFTRCSFDTSNNESSGTALTWSGNTVTLRGGYPATGQAVDGNASGAFNQDGGTYFWFAIG